MARSFKFILVRGDERKNTYRKIGFYLKIKRRR
jgi:hypothetical protein